MNIKPKVALYARVSKDDIKGMQASMTEQNHIIRALAKSTGTKLMKLSRFPIQPAQRKWRDLASRR